MDEKKPLLSIVVPTKDRYPYLKKLITLIKGFNSDEIEMIVQDNTEENAEIKEYISEQGFANLKYFHTPEQIPVYLNCDKSILNSTGEYVSFIGDDDGVTRFVIDCAHWMKSKGAECVMPQSIGYQWPDFVSAIEHANGKMSHKEFDGSVVKKRSMDELTSLMEKGMINRGGVPLVYHAIVKRSTLDKIYEKCETYFPGPSPDLANGVALCLVMENFYTISLPITISGASRAHGGGIRLMKNRLAKIEDLPFLPEYTSREWEPRIPKVWAGETIWPDSAVVAMRRMGRPDLVEKINFEALYVSFITFHYPYRNLALKLTSHKWSVLLKSYIYIVKRFFWAARRLVYSRIFKKDYGLESVYGLETINDAVERLEKKYANLEKATFV